MHPLLIPLELSLSQEAMVFMWTTAPDELFEEKQKTTETGMINQNIVITMAGRGSRFYEAGYTMPKYEIMAHGHSLFHWSMRSLKNFVTPGSRLIYVCLAENHSADYVYGQCRILGLKDVHIVELDQVTDGQATSAYMSRALWQPNASLLIYNIDTYVNPNVLQPAQIRQGSDGWIPCFGAAGDHWSFVKIGEDGWATDVTEKQRISDHASIGLYWFSRAEEYVRSYENFFADQANLVRGERYIAPMYKSIMKIGGHISVTDLPIKDVHVLGTPNELKQFMQKTITDF